VLGKTIKENGMNEGLEVLHMLATSPATAKFISTKLAVRFVSDDPPPALVDRMAQSFLASDGDIKTVLRTMFESPEFWAPATERAKVKTPEEFVVSAVRASGATVNNSLALVQALDKLGMPLYGMQTPNGYSWMSEPWVSTGALVSRMNFALVLSGDRLPGVRTDWSKMLGREGFEQAGCDGGDRVSAGGGRSGGSGEGTEAGADSAGAAAERKDAGGGAGAVDRLDRGDPGGQGLSGRQAGPAFWVRDRLRTSNWQGRERRGQMRPDDRAGSGDGRAAAGFAGVPEAIGQGEGDRFGTRARPGLSYGYGDCGNFVADVEFELVRDTRGGAKVRYFGTANVEVRATGAAT
jgi:hypothetical protein